MLKTTRRFCDALTILLKKRNFNKITVNDLCEEAQLSRATFYARFEDKYYFLRFWLSGIKNYLVQDNKINEKAINQSFRANSKTITNLLDDANGETIELLKDFIISVLGITSDGKDKQYYIVISNFCAGGILNCIRWLIKNDFHAGVETINPYFSEILNLVMSGDIL